MKATYSLFSLCLSGAVWFGNSLIRWGQSHLQDCKLHEKLWIALRRLYSSQRNGSGMTTFTPLLISGRNKSY